jgi:hypothetical protein
MLDAEPSNGTPELEGFIPPVAVATALPFPAPTAPLVGAITVEVVIVALEEAAWAGRKPLQSPVPLQVLKAHCESFSQAALKLPHERMVKAVEPQQLAPFLHCLSSEQISPRFREPAAAVMGAWPEGWLPAVPVMMEGVAAVVEVEGVFVVAAEEEDWARKPLQRPLLAQVLKAHCESSAQAALKLPQARIVSLVVP